MTTISRASATTPPRPELHEVRIALAHGAPVRDVLFMPFPCGRHPETDAVGAEHFAWLREHGLLDERNRRVFERARFHDLAGRIHHQDERDTVRLVADFIATLFVLDDLLDGDGDPACKSPLRARVAIERIRRSARAGSVTAGPRDVIDAVAAGLADITRRLQHRDAPLAAYLAQLDLSLDALVEETRRRTSGFRSVEDYAAVRTAFSAVYACLELGLAAEGRTFAPELRPLARAMNLSVSYVNDVFSWPKEHALGERSNLVRVLMDQHHFAEATAIHAACHSSDRVVVDYLAARDGLGGPHGCQLALLESWMRGNLDWHAEGTERYREHLSVATGAGPGVERAQLGTGA